MTRKSNQIVCKINFIRYTKNNPRVYNLLRTVTTPTRADDSHALSSRNIKRYSIQNGSIREIPVKQEENITQGLQFLIFYFQEFADKVKFA